MVRRFYADVAQDDLLGPMFEEVADVDWAEHLPKLAAFWCRALLSMPGYEGNPYRAHQEVHARRPMRREHFERWLDLFHDTVDIGWAGPKAEQAKALARKVAFVHSKQIVGDPVIDERTGVEAVRSSGSSTAVPPPRQRNRAEPMRASDSSLWSRSS